MVSGGHKGRCHVVDWLGMFSIMCLWIEKSAVWLKSPALLILIVSCVCMCYVVLFVSGTLIGVLCYRFMGISFLSRRHGLAYITTDIRI